MNNNKSVIVMLVCAWWKRSSLGRSSVSYKLTRHGLLKTTNLFIPYMESKEGDRSQINVWWKVGWHSIDSEHGLNWSPGRSKAVSMAPHSWTWRASALDVQHWNHQWTSYHIMTRCPQSEPRKLNKKVTVNRCTCFLSHFTQNEKCVLSRTVF